MNIIVSGQHLKLTDALREYAIMKCRKVEKYFDGINEIKLNLAVDDTKSEGPIHSACATMYLAGKTIRIEDEDRSLYSAIDEMLDKMIRQVKKYKDMKADKK